MSNKNFLTFILVAITILGCGSMHKKQLSSNAMINEIIKDYYKNNKRYIKNYSVFKIQRKEMESEEIEVFQILPENDEIAYVIFLEDSLNRKYLPTNYLDYRDRLFLWQERNTKISDSVMQYIYNKKLVDSSYVKYQMGLIPEEDIQFFKVSRDNSMYGLDYIFCKSNPSKIKKKIKSTLYTYPEDKRLQVKCD